MGTLTRMSPEGQVTIPKDVRDALGLEPGEAVEFDFNNAGEAVIRRPKRDHGVEREGLIAKMRAVSEQFAHLRDGRSTDETMRDIRGDDPFPP